jgi:hypothetical protein
MRWAGLVIGILGIALALVASLRHRPGYAPATGSPGADEAYANLLYATGSFADPEAEVRSWMQRAPDDPRFHLLLGDLRAANIFWPPPCRLAGHLTGRDGPVCMDVESAGGQTREVVADDPAALVEYRAAYADDPRCGPALARIAVLAEGDERARAIHALVDLDRSDPLPWILLAGEVRPAGFVPTPGMVPDWWPRLRKACRAVPSGPCGSAGLPTPDPALATRLAAGGIASDCWWARQAGRFEASVSADRVFDALREVIRVSGRAKVRGAVDGAGHEGYRLARVMSRPSRGLLTGSPGGWYEAVRLEDDLAQAYGDLGLQREAAGARERADALGRAASQKELSALLRGR